MDKQYSEYLDEISENDLYEGLLGYGMFADKLPPVFTSVPFLSYCQQNTPSFSNCKWSDYVRYSSMRNVNIPRALGVPTPMKYYELCLILRDNWQLLQQHFQQQTVGHEYRISRIHLRKMFGRKELFEMNYKNWRSDGNPETDLLFSFTTASKYIVKADISTCFPSIYTHSLPWALVGKDKAKETCHKEALWYNKIDSACAAMKNGETHGLIIGPVASNLLSEVVLTVVDKKLYDKGYRYSRNIDDYECYTESYEQSQCFLHDLEEALSEYDLPLNHKKTSISALPVAATEKWIHKLNSYLAIAKDIINYKDVNAYLDLAIGLANEYGDSAILKYAIKSLSSKNLTANAKKLAAQRIMHVSAIYPYLVHLMEGYIFGPFGVTTEYIKRYADALYTDALSSHNYEAISYAIYFSLKYGFALDKLDIEWVIKRGDCVLLLMTWMYYLKLNSNNTLASDLKPLRSEARRLMGVDMGRYWLFCYEVLSAGNLKGDWAKLKKAGITFLRTGLNSLDSE